MEDFMPRKRKSDDTPSTETTTISPDAPPEGAATAVAEPPPAELPVAQLAPAEAPTAEPKADGQSFAERVGQKKWTAAPDPFGIAKDNLAGVRLFESRQDGQVAIKFGDGSPEQKPSQAVINRVKEAGYRWNPSDRIWAHPLNGMSTRIEAEKLYQEVRQMIRQEKGIDPGQEVPF
jgi:hypothetical protein